MSVEPLAPRVLGDTWVDRLDLPDRVSAGATLVATVSVGSQRDASVLRRGEVGRRRDRVALGRDRKGNDRRRRRRCPRDTGLHVLQASVTTAGDPSPRTTRSSAACGPIRSRRCCTSKGVPSSARYLSGALDGIRVRRRRDGRPAGYARRPAPSSIRSTWWSSATSRATPSARAAMATLASGWSEQAAGSWWREERLCSASGAIARPRSSARTGDVRTAGRAVARAGAGARPIVEHERHVDGAVQDRRAGRRRRHGRRAGPWRSDVR